MSAIDYNELAAQVAEMDREEARLSVVSAHVRALVRAHVEFGVDGGVCKDSIRENLMDTLACPSDVGIMRSDMDYVVHVVDMAFDVMHDQCRSAMSRT